jgi:hypothetical protein
VVQLDQMTQQNAALVEESAAAAESLKHQATTLAQAVGTFKLQGMQATAPGAAPAAPAAAAKPAARAPAAVAPQKAEPKAPVTPQAAVDAKPAQRSGPFAQMPIASAMDDDWETF